MRAKRLNIRLFLEGVEVPVISANVTCGTNEPATAAIQIVPTDDVHNLLPRTLVHLFFYDLYPDTGGMDAANKSMDSGLSTLSPEEKDAIGNNYRLLFMGEVLGYTFQKVSGNRSVVLQCSDFSSYWDAAKQYFHTGGTNSSGSKGAAFMGTSSVGFEEDDKTSPTKALMRILNTRSSTLPDLPGLLGGIVHLLESIGGVYAGRKKFRGINDFFSAAELRLRLTQMIGATHKDTTSSKLFNHKSMRKWIKQTIARNKSLASFRQILSLLLRRVYHDYASVSSPAFLGARTATIRVGVPGKRVVSGKTREHVEKRIEKLEKTKSVVLDDNETTNATRRDQINSDNSDTKFNISNTDAIANHVRNETSTASEEDRRRHKSVSILDKAVSNDYNYYQRLAKDLGARSSTMEKSGTSAKTALKLYKQSLKARHYGSKLVDVPVLERIPTHLFRPNIFFAPPPRCNVIFPDMYSFFSYRRNFLQEVTRLQLTAQKEWKQDTTGLIEGGSRKKYWAPEVQATNDILSRVNARKGVRFVMDHEKFPGIVPKFENIADISAFQKIDRKQGGRRKIPYMQRLANYNYFLYKFGPRTAQLQLHLNPYLVPGLPALVIDQYVADSVRDRMGIQPTQYLGMIDKLTHSISQNGGSTSAILTHCRTDKEDLADVEREFVVGWTTKLKSVIEEAVVDGVIPGTDDIGAFIESGRDGNIIHGDRKHTLSGGVPPIVGDAIGAISFGKVSYKDTDGKVVRKDHPDAFIGVKVPGKGEVAQINPITPIGGPGIGEGGSLWSHFKSPKTGSSVGQQALVEVVYKKRYPIKRTFSFPPEKALFPPWMSPIYTNLNIGRDFYQELLKIGSIVDAMQIGFVPASEVIAGGDYIDPVLRHPDSGEVHSVMSPGEINSIKQEEVERMAGEALARKTDGTSLSDEDVAAEVRIGASVSDAVDQIVKAYRQLKETGHSTDSFFKAFTWRPIVSLPEVLGSNLFDLKGTDKDYKKRTLLDGEGFHSRAFGDLNNLDYLNHKAARRISRKGKSRYIDKKVDPRAERFRAVQVYAGTLRRDKGQLG